MPIGKKAVVKKKVVAKPKPVKKATPVLEPQPDAKPVVKVELKPIEPPKPKRVTNLNEFEVELYDKVLDALNNVRDSFSTRTSSGYAIGDIVTDTQGKISLNVLDGSFITPYELNLTLEEKEEMKKAISKVVEKDKQEIIKVLLKK